jgi:hypothetical protein
MTQQSMHMVRIPDGRVAVVAGCAGGRVRILTNQTFEAWNPQSPGVTFPQALNDISSTPVDLGLGAAALHAEIDSTGSNIVVWFGSCYAPPPLPGQYASNSPAAVGNLTDAEVAAGAVHRIEWSIASGTWGLPLSVPLNPSAAARGAGPVGGLLLADMISTNPGQELIAACMTGDLIVLHPTTLAVLGRTHVGGAVGHYNSMVVADLGDGEAIYIAGSLGLRRVTP